MGERRIGEITWREQRGEDVTGGQRYLWTEDRGENGGSPIKGRLPFCECLEAIKISGAEGVEDEGCTSTRAAAGRIYSAW